MSSEVTFWAKEQYLGFVNFFNQPQGATPFNPRAN